MKIDWNKLLAKAAAGDITQTDWQILDVIYNQGLMAYSDIADMIGVHPRTVKRRAKSLVRIIS